MPENRTCLWVATGVATLLVVCCVGVALGSVAARLGTPDSPDLRAVSTLPVVAAEPSQDPADSVPEQVVQSSEESSISGQAPEKRPTALPYPTPPPPTASPASPPTGSDLQALVAYANEMKPMLDEAGRLLERDGKILEASEGGNDTVLCDGRLAADNASMKKVLRRARRITAPTDAVALHDLVLSSGEAWTESLNYVGLFCETGNELHKLPAVLKFWEAAATLQDAANRFWLLLIAEGVEDWVSR